MTYAGAANNITELVAQGVAEEVAGELPEADPVLGGAGGA